METKKLTNKQYFKLWIGTTVAMIGLMVAGAEPLGWWNVAGFAGFAIPCILLIINQKTNELWNK